MIDVPKWVRAGASFTHFNRRYHVRGFVDGIPIARVWRTSKRYWEYVPLYPEWWQVNEFFIKRRRNK